MRAGLQDYELLRMLNDVVDKAKPERGTKEAGVLNKARRLLSAVRGPIAGSLTDFSRDTNLILRTRRKAGEYISILTA